MDQGHLLDSGPCLLQLGQLCATGRCLRRSCVVGTSCHWDSIAGGRHTGVETAGPTRCWRQPCLPCPVAFSTVGSWFRMFSQTHLPRLYYRHMTTFTSCALRYHNNVALCAPFTPPRYLECLDAHPPHGAGDGESAAVPGDDPPGQCTGMTRHSPPPAWPPPPAPHPAHTRHA